MPAAGGATAARGNDDEVFAVAVEAAAGVPADEARGVSAAPEEDAAGGGATAAEAPRTAADARALDEDARAAPPGGPPDADAAPPVAGPPGAAAKARADAGEAGDVAAAPGADDEDAAAGAAVADAPVASAPVVSAEVGVEEAAGPRASGVDEAMAEQPSEAEAGAAAEASAAPLAAAQVGAAPAEEAAGPRASSVDEASALREALAKQEAELLKAAKFGQELVEQNEALRSELQQQQQQRRAAPGPVVAYEWPPPSPSASSTARSPSPGGRVVRFRMASSSPGQDISAVESVPSLDVSAQWPARPRQNSDLSVSSSLCTPRRAAPSRWTPLPDTPTRGRTRLRSVGWLREQLELDMERKMLRRRVAQLQAALDRRHEIDEAQRPRPGSVDFHSSIATPPRAAPRETPRRMSEALLNHWEAVGAGALYEVERKLRREFDCRCDELRSEKADAEAKLASLRAELRQHRSELETASDVQFALWEQAEETMQHLRRAQNAMDAKDDALNLQAQRRSARVLSGRLVSTAPTETDLMAHSFSRTQSAPSLQKEVTDCTVAALVDEVAELREQLAHCERQQAIFLGTPHADETDAASVGSAEMSWYRGADHADVAIASSSCAPPFILAGDGVEPSPIPLTPPASPWASSVQPVHTPPPAGGLALPSSQWTPSPMRTMHFVLSEKVSDDELGSASEEEDAVAEDNYYSYLEGRGGGGEARGEQQEEEEAHERERERSPSPEASVWDRWTRAAIGFLCFSERDAANFNFDFGGTADSAAGPTGLPVLFPRSPDDGKADEG